MTGFFFVRRPVRPAFASVFAQASVGQRPTAPPPAARRLVFARTPLMPAHAVRARTARPGWLARAADWLLRRLGGLRPARA